MLPFFFLLIRRWSRASAGRAAAAVVLVVPVVLVLAQAVIELVRNRSGLAGLAKVGPDIVAVWNLGLIACLDFSLVNFLAFAIHEERANSRSRLLRIGGVDGLPSVGAYAALGVLFATTLPLGTALSTSLAGTLLGIGTTGSWFRLAFGCGLLAIQAIPVTLAAAFYFPRAAALLVVNGIALFLPALPIVGSAKGRDAIIVHPREMAIASAVNLAAVLFLAWHWRRRSGEHWS